MIHHWWFTSFIATKRYRLLANTSTMRLLLGLLIQERVLLCLRKAPNRTVITSDQRSKSLLKKENACSKPEESWCEKPNSCKLFWIIRCPKTIESIVLKVLTRVQGSSSKAPKFKNDLKKSKELLFSMLTNSFHSKSKQVYIGSREFVLNEAYQVVSCYKKKHFS